MYITNGIRVSLINDFMISSIQGETTPASEGSELEKKKGIPYAFSSLGIE